jgi:hypothetical protein
MAWKKCNSAIQSSCVSPLAPLALNVEQFLSLYMDILFCGGQSYALLDG